MRTPEQVKIELLSNKLLSKYVDNREVSELHNILMDNEVIERLLDGTYKDGVGLLIATNLRLIFIDKGVFYGLKVEDFTYDKINSIQYSLGFMFGDITIYTHGNQSLIDNVDKENVKEFCDFVRNRIAEIEASKSIQSNTSAPNSSSDDVINKLERLAKLKEQGILTDEEFAQQKMKILSM